MTTLQHLTQIIFCSYPSKTCVYANVLHLLVSIILSFQNYVYLFWVCCHLNCALSCIWSRERQTHWAHRYNTISDSYQQNSLILYSLEEALTPGLQRRDIDFDHVHWTVDISNRGARKSANQTFIMEKIMLFLLNMCYRLTTMIFSIFLLNYSITMLLFLLHSFQWLYIYKYSLVPN